MSPIYYFKGLITPSKKSTAPTNFIHDTLKSSDINPCYFGRRTSELVSESQAYLKLTKTRVNRNGPNTKKGRFQLCTKL